MFMAGRLFVNYSKRLVEHGNTGMTTSKVRRWSRPRRCKTSLSPPWTQSATPTSWTSASSQSGKENIYTYIYMNDIIIFRVFQIASVYVDILLMLMPLIKYLIYVAINRREFCKLQTTFILGMISCTQLLLGFFSYKKSLIL